MHPNDLDRTSAPPQMLGWSVLAPLVLCGAAAIGLALVRARPAWLVGVVLCGSLGAGIAWIVVSTFWPAKADRTCPACGAKALERADSSSVRGLVCRACGERDASASAWFLAEEEGPLEPLVLRERGRRRAHPASAAQEESS